MQHTLSLEGRGLRSQGLVQARGPSYSCIGMHRSLSSLTRASKNTHRSVRGQRGIRVGGPALLQLCQVPAALGGLSIGEKGHVGIGRWGCCCQRCGRLFKRSLRSRECCADLSCAVGICTRFKHRQSGGGGLATRFGIGADVRSLVTSSMVHWRASTPQHAETKPTHINTPEDVSYCLASL